MASATILDIAGGVVTVAAEWDDETRAVSLLAVTNTLTVGERPSPLRVVLGDIVLDAPPGYTEKRFTRERPILPDPIPAPRREVHYG